MIKRIIFLFVVLAVCGMTAKAQRIGATPDGTIVVESLFEYPVAPAYLEDINAKSDYLMDNFWKPMNFKAKSVSQDALTHAFSVYVAPMRWATKAKVINSVNDLLKKLNKNPGLLLQFTRAAEESLYGPRAECYIDEVYEMFLEGVIANKKINNKRKEKYSRQLNAIRNCRLGDNIPSLELTDTQGELTVQPRGNYFTLFVFGNANQPDLRHWLLKLTNNLTIDKLVQQGDLAIIYASTGEKSEAEDAQIESLKEPWQGGYATNHTDFDIRLTPCIYVFDANNKIVAKNADLSQALRALTAPISESAPQTEQ